MTIYDLKSLKLPVLYGRMLSIFASAVENPLTSWLLLGNLLRNGGIPKFRQIDIDDHLTLYPLHRTAENESQVQDLQTFDPLGKRAVSRTPYSTIRDYAEAYRNGNISPVEVARNVLEAISTSDRLEYPLRAFIAVYRDDVLDQARAAEQRFWDGQPLSIFDGVPVAIKDEVDMVPYPTTVGTAIYQDHKAQVDSTVVARLRAAGALLIGKANMHEFGINPDGSNNHHGRVCNPWDLQSDSGGSSSGPAAATAAGFCPVSIGADGGGSIRVPAALCGVVGLKPTYGRVSDFGSASEGLSVGHLGPIGTSVEDVALAYTVIAGPDPACPNSQYQPPIRMEDWDNVDLSGLRIGIFWDWFLHADEEVVSINRKMVDMLQDAGAQISDILIPELDNMRIAHIVTIISELADNAPDQKTEKADFGKLAPSTRLNLVLASAFSSNDYIRAQRMRTRAMKIFDKVFQDVDVIITPATAIAAPPVPHAALSNGWSDLSAVTELMRYVFAPNLTGHPAISFPAGYNSAGMPVGMQAIGRHWEEHVLLRIAYSAEQVVERKLPRVHYKII
ncbi:MAG: amidase [Anaerolineaceae bacterium]|nr:amidase [Anaerolineaceae bacterium]